MTRAQIRGMDVFLNKAKCDSCHEGVNFTSNAYANLAIGTDKPGSFGLGQIQNSHAPRYL